MDRGVLGSNVGGRYGEREERREIVQVKILEDSWHYVCEFCTGTSFCWVKLNELFKSEPKDS